MKKIIFLALSIIYIQFAFAQSRGIGYCGVGRPYSCSYPPTSIVNGETNWCGEPISKTLGRAEIIFEGRVLSRLFRKNAHEEDDDVIIDYQVLVLKQFKGTFISDTIVVRGDNWACNVGDEALLCLYSSGNTYHILKGMGCGFIGVCNRSDINEKVYKPIEAVTGQKYVDVHPNTCATQKKK